MARLIRESSKSGSDVRPFNVEDVLAKLKIMEAQARSRATALIEAARADAKSTHTKSVEEGHKEGYDAGWKQGLIEGKAEGEANAKADILGHVDPLQQALQVILGSIESDRETIRQRATGDLLDLAFAMAEMVVQARIEMDTETVQRSVTRAIDLVLDKSRIEVIVHPDCVEMLEEYIPKLRNRFDDIRDFALIGDDTVLPGGCRIEAGDASVDATLKTQLEEIHKQLMGL